jgi:hypothetical protein
MCFTEELNRNIPLREEIRTRKEVVGLRETQVQSLNLAHPASKGFQKLYSEEV